MWSKPFHLSRRSVHCIAKSHKRCEMPCMPKQQHVITQKTSYVIVTLVGSGWLGYTVKGTHTSPAVEETISCDINAGSILLEQ